MTRRDANFIRVSSASRACTMWRATAATTTARPTIRNHLFSHSLVFQKEAKHADQMTRRDDEFEVTDFRNIADPLAASKPAMPIDRDEQARREAIRSGGHRALVQGTRPRAQRQAPSSLGIVVVEFWRWQIDKLCRFGTWHNQWHIFVGCHCWERRRLQSRRPLRPRRPSESRAVEERLAARYNSK
jgi:hypothetical protein